jgi:hypothetical protein
MKILIISIVLFFGGMWLWDQYTEARIANPAVSAPLYTQQQMDTQAAIWHRRGYTDGHWDGVASVRCDLEAARAGQDPLQLRPRL